MVRNNVMTRVRALPALRPKRPAPSIPKLSGRAIVSGKCFLRGDQKLPIHGVTYGPFAPNSKGSQFPAREVVRYDFARMHDAGFNAVRTYLTPPGWLFELAAEHDLLLFVDVPWRKHVCFLDSHEARQEAREAVRRAATVGHHHTNLLA